MDKVRINGAELQYAVTGTGDPVLLIGTGPIADSFLPFVSQKALADRFCLIRYHQRRINASGSTAAGVSFAQHATDGVALLDHLGIGSAHVAGHSTGAAIALQMAFDYAARVQSLALLEPPLMAVPSAPAFLESVGPALDAYWSGDREGAMAKFLSMVCSLEWDSCRTYIERHVPGGVARAVNDADNFFGSYLPALSAWQFDRRQTGALRQPVLSVVGSNTHRLFAESHELLCSWFSGIEECRIDGLAHLLHLQQPEPVARAVGEFFARYPIGARESALAV